MAPFSLGGSMGLFSSKKKTEVETTVVRVVEDNLIPETAKASLLRYSMNGDVNASVAESMLDDMLGSLAFRGDRMYEYAKKSYAYGLPKSNLVSVTQGNDVVRQVVSSVVGKAVTLEYCHYAAYNSIHYGWKTITEQYGYDANSNELKKLSTQLGTTVWLKDMVAVFCQNTVNQAEPGILDTWGTAANAGYTPARLLGGLVNEVMEPTPYVIDTLAGHDTVEVTYTYRKDGKLVDGKLVLNVDPPDEEGEYFQVKYRYSTLVAGKTVNHYGYWTYQADTGLFPELDKLFETDFSALGSYMPRAYFRLDRKNLAIVERKNTAEYKTTKKLLKYLSIDYQDMADSIYDNTDLEYIEQAFLMMGVPINGKSEAERQYLFNYFNALFYSTEGAFAYNNPLREAANEFTRRGSRAIRIQDKGFTMTLAYQGIAKRRMSGKIGPIGSHSYSSGTEQYKETVTYREGTRQTSGTRTVSVKYHAYKRQLTSALYDEVRVYEPRLTYHIWSKYNYVAGSGKNQLLVPLDHAITDLIPLSERETLYYKALHFVFNSRVTTKTKWYQTGVFKIVVVIVAIVIAVFTGQWQAAYAALAAAAAAGMVALALTILTFIVKTLVVQYTFKLFAKAVGPEFALVAAVVGAIVGVGMSMTSAQGSSTALWGERLLQSSVGLSKGAGGAIQEDMNDLQGDWTDFQSYQETQNAALKAGQDLLQTTNLLDPLMFTEAHLTPQIRFGESPQDYFTRTIHAGNVGVVGIDAVAYYHDMALTLPRLSDSVEESAWG